MMQRGREAAPRVDRATFQRGDYGRVVRADGTEQWWVRSSNGTWIALAHQRVIENGDGTITLLYLK
jgi:predicted lipoprotein with Yx(FWY)xxD motif